MPGVGFALTIAHAPAPAEVVEAVVRIEVETSTAAAGIFRLELAIEQTDLGDWSVLADDLFRPLVPVGIRVQTGAALPEAVLNGYVAGQRAVYGDDGASTLEVTGMDVTMLMNLEEKVVAWPNLPDGAIASAIFGQHGVVPEAEPTSPPLVEPEGTTIQRGTDARFLRRLARRNGFDVYVLPEPLTGLDVGTFGPRRALGLPQAVLNVHMGEETNVSGFAVRSEMTRPTTAQAAALDVATKAPQPALAPASLEQPLGLEPTLARIVPPPVVRPAGTGLVHAGDLQTFAQGIADRSSWSVLAEGTAGPDVGVLRPGGLVNVRGAGRLTNGSYVVTRVLHTVTRDGYVQRFEAERNALSMTGAELFLEI